MSEHHHRDGAAASHPKYRWWLVASLILVLALGIGLRLTVRAPSAAAPSTIRATAIFPVHRIGDVSAIPTGPAEQVQLVYFHRTQRCQGCIAAERLTRQTLDTYFSDQLASGVVSITSLDVQAPENDALAQKYDASGSALYFNVRKRGTEYLCEEAEIWFVFNDEAKFMALLRDKLLRVLE